MDHTIFAGGGYLSKVSLLLPVQVVSDTDCAVLRIPGLIPNGVGT